MTLSPSRQEVKSVVLLLTAILLSSLLPSATKAFVSPRLAFSKTTILLSATTNDDEVLGRSLLEQFASSDDSVAAATTTTTRAVTDSFVGDMTDSIGTSMDVLAGLPQEALYAGVAVLTLAGVAAVAVAAADSGRSSDTSEASSSSSRSAAFKKKKAAAAAAAAKVDVSIPYDAAARLAYDKWCSNQPAEMNTPETYQKFKLLYEQTAIADVTAKQATRKLQNFDPTKPDVVVVAPTKKVETEIPTLKVATSNNKVSTTKSQGKPFFADF